jgi:3-oxoacyl-[acyl-carrier protein] reductase
MNILITGGSKGIGNAILLELANNPSNNLYFTYNKTKPTFSLPNCHPIQVDLTHEPEFLDFLRLIDSLEIQVLINNYHTGYYLSHAHKVDIHQLRNGMASNIYPTIALTNALIPKFRKAKNGKIITILTNYVYQFPTGAAQYAAEKRYLSGFVDAWNQENKNWGISSTGIFPGLIKTDFHNKLPILIDFEKESKIELVSLLNNIKTLIYVI